MLITLSAAAAAAIGPSLAAVGAFLASLVGVIF